VCVSNTCLEKIIKKDISIYLVKMERHLTNFDNNIAGKPGRTEPMRAMKILNIT